MTKNYKFKLKYVSQDIFTCSGRQINRHFDGSYTISKGSKSINVKNRDDLDDLLQVLSTDHTLNLVKRFGTKSNLSN